MSRDIRVIGPAPEERSGPRWDVVDAEYPARVIACFYYEADAVLFAEWWATVPAPAVFGPEEL